MNESTVVKENDFIKPDIHDVDYFVDDTIKDCRNSFFIHSNIDLFMILVLQILLVMKKSISQRIIDLWSLKMSFMV